jgi:uncharacterized protein
VLILLPPSEGKTAPAPGPPVDLASLSFPELTRERRRVLTSLVALCRADPQEAARVLGLGVQQRLDVKVNTLIRRAPCSPAMDVYSGVLFDALAYRTLPARARRRADETVVVSSALWGLVRPTDLIPYYRLSGSVTLPALGTLASVWRESVSRTLAAQPGLIVDLRSGTYQSLGPVPRSCAERAVVVRVLQDVGGRRTIVSHSNKATKGRIAMAIVSARTQPSTSGEFMAALADWGFTAEPGPTARAGAPASIDVIVSAV